MLSTRDGLECFWEGFNGGGEIFGGGVVVANIIREWCTRSWQCLG